MSPQAHAAEAQYWTQRQAPAFESQAPPVQNTWYTILDTTLDARLWYIAVTQINDEAAGKTIEVRVTIDGRVLTDPTPPGQASNTEYWWCWYTNPPTGTEHLTQNSIMTTAGSQELDQGVFLDGHSIKVEMRITAVPGTNQILRGYVIYDLHRAT